MNIFRYSSDDIRRSSCEPIAEISPFAYKVIVTRTKEYTQLREIIAKIIREMLKEFPLKFPDDWLYDHVDDIWSYDPVKACYLINWVVKWLTPKKNLPKNFNPKKHLLNPKEVIDVTWMFKDEKK